MPREIVTAVYGPWERVVDSSRAGEPDPAALRDCVDAWVGPDGRVLARPGMVQLATHPGAPGAGQGIAGMELAGTDYLFAVVGGVLAKYDWATDTWTTCPHVGTAINATGAVALRPFFDQLIVSDGVNRPWSYNPSTNASAYLGCSSGPWYGPPIVRDAKLQAIKADERRTLVWSEEADATIGGDVPPYNDAWDLRQQAQDALTALVATNGTTVYQRSDSTGRILGQVNSEYQASGTHDDLSQKRGTLSPFASLALDDARSPGVVWAIDRLGVPYRIKSGSGVEDIGLACRDTVQTVDTSRLFYAWSVYLPDVDAVAFALPRTAGNAYNTDLLLFSRDGGAYLGRWRVPTGAGASIADFAWGTIASDDSGQVRLVVLDHAGKVAVCWRVDEAARDSTKWLDVTLAGGSALPATRVVLPDAVLDGADQKVFVQWTTLVLETGAPRNATIPPVLAASGATAVAYEVETPSEPFGYQLAKTVIVPRTGKLDVGISRFGRWARVALSAALGGAQQFALWRVTVIGSKRDTGTRRK